MSGDHTGNVFGNTNAGTTNPANPFNKNSLWNKFFKGGLPLCLAVIFSPVRVLPGVLPSTKIARVKL